MLQNVRVSIRKWSPSHTTNWADKESDKFAKALLMSASFAEYTVRQTLFSGYRQIAKVGIFQREFHAVRAQHRVMRHQPGIVVLRRNPVLY